MIFFFFTPSKTDITRNTEYKLYVEYSKTNFRKLTFSNRIAPAWSVLSLITKSTPNINKLKNLLNRDPNLLVNKYFDWDSYFFFVERKIVACSSRPNQLNHEMGRKKAAEAYSKPYFVSVSARFSA